MAVAPGQIQPASLDLRLAEVAYRVRASFLPGPKTDVASKLSELSLHTIDLTHGAVLETGCVYVVPLLESLNAAAGDFSGRQSEKLHRPPRCVHARHRRWRDLVRYDSRAATKAGCMRKFARRRFPSWCGAARC